MKQKLLDYSKSLIPTLKKVMKIRLFASLPNSRGRFRDVCSNCSLDIAKLDSSKLETIFCDCEL